MTRTEFFKQCKIGDYRTIAYIGYGKMQLFSGIVAEERLGRKNFLWLRPDNADTTAGRQGRSYLIYDYITEVI